MAAWLWGWIIGGAVVVVAALLLLWIIWLLASIDKHARRALAALRRVERNTAATWSLAGVADRLDRIVNHADAMERRAEAAAARLSTPGAGRRP